MNQRDDQRSLELARRGILAAGTAGLAVVAFSIWTLIGIGDVVEEPAPPPAPRVETVVETVPVRPELWRWYVQVASPATPSDLAQLDVSSTDWAPEALPGGAVVDFSVSNEIIDGGTETFLIADSFAGIQGVQGGETVMYKVREGELVLVQNTPSGWPDPEITCDDGNAFVSGSAVFLTTRIGPPVACTIKNTRDADSLSVTKVRLTCDVLLGEVRGPLPPFVVTLQAINPDSDARLSARLGDFRIAESGPFQVPIRLLEELQDDGVYQLSITTHDFAGSQVVLANAAELTIANSVLSPCTT